MKVKELMEELAKYDPDSRVVVATVSTEWERVDDESMEIDEAVWGDITEEEITLHETGTLRLGRLPYE